MSTTIESLELEIQSNSKSAVSGIDALTQSLEKLRNASKGGVGLGAVSKQLREISSATSSINSSATSDVSGLAKAIQLLNGTKISSSIANQITAISKSLQGADFTGGRAKIEGLVDALSPLSNLGKTNLSSYVSNIKKLPDTINELNKIDMASLKAKIQELATAFKPLGDEMQKVANGFSSFPSKIQKLLNATNQIPKSNNAASISFTDLYYKIKSVAMVVARVGKSIWSHVKKSMDYTENMNLFTVSMGEYASEAKAYAEEVSNVVGIDTSEWVRNQGIFMTMATGFGVAGDRAALMSQNLTQLGYDIASFYNTDVDTAMQKLKSGLAGELEPLRAIGYDLSQAKLEAIALELGIDKAVTSMTQAEKAQLRYYAMMTQVTVAQTDMARTLDDPANQVRVFKSQVSMASREIGNVFIPALNAIIPYATAVAQVIRTVASTIAGLGGYVDSGLKDGIGSVVENTDAITENLAESQEEAKKLKSYMLGFDELNVINPDTGSGGEDASSQFEFELPTYNFLDGLAESKVATIVEDMKEWLGITEEITSWSDLLTTNFGNILVSVGLIAAGIIGWKIGTLLTDIPRLIKMLGGLKGALAGIGIATAIATATAGVVWLVKHVDTTTEKIGAIISGAAIAVGAILAFTGINLPLGLALMAVGAISMGTAIALNTNKLSDEIKGVIAVIAGIVSLALLEVGAILAFSGVGIPLGIALMAGGALTMGTAVIPNWNKLSDSVQDTISAIFAIVGPALLVVGAILAFTGANIPLGIGLMLGGATSLGTAMALNWNALPDLLRGPVGEIVAIVSAATLALGAILAFSGVAIPLGIALMIIGAGGLATVAAVNWDSIKDALEGPVGTITNIVSGALLALGAILTFSGVAIPLGIALMVLGAAGLATVTALNWDKVKEDIETPVGAITAIVSGALLALGAILAFTGVGIPLGIALMLTGAVGLVSAITVDWSSIQKKIDEVIEGIAKGIKGMLNWAIDGINDLFNIQYDGLVIAGVEIIPAFNVQLISIPQIPTYADGAFDIPTGQMFIAREAGAEMVGSIGRKTAVANNDQIVSGIAGGVAEANEEQNVLLREQNSLLRAILEKDSGVYLDGKNLTSSVEKYQRERGRVLITGGVL